LLAICTNHQGRLLLLFLFLLRAQHFGHLSS
jgi:hypothetical protein